MKKLICIATLFLSTICISFAQTDTTTTTTNSGLSSDEGITILPEEGEWGLGISANPFLTYLGNFFNQAGNNGAPSYAFVQNPFNSLALYGKLMKDENTAFRARFQFDMNTSGTKGVVAQSVLTPDPFSPQFVTDTRTASNTAVLLAFGLEKRRGAGRLQGVYGGEALIGFASTKDKYSYGNAINQQFTAPATTDFGNNLLAANRRKTTEKIGSKFMFGVRGFIGVEYFFAPKMSIGGEFGYTFGITTAGKGSVTTEAYDATSTSARTITSQAYDANYNRTYTGIGLDNLNGSINLLFYF